MDLRSLKYFQVVAQSGSYSRGSELLRISQPAVSRTINMLEEELGKPLFVRHNHGVSLTEAGRLLLERSQAILRQVDETINEIRHGDEGPSGTITIALPPTAGYFLAPALLERLHEEFPKVFIRFVGGFSGYIHEWLIRGQVDIACLHDPVPQRGFETHGLLREQVFLVRKADPRNPVDGPVSSTDLMSMPLVLPSGTNATRRLLDNWAAQQGLWFQPKIEVDDHIMTRALIRSGQAMSLLTRGAFADDLAHGDVEAFPTAPPIYWTLKLVTCLRASPSPLAELFAQRIVEVAARIRESGIWHADAVTPAPG